MHQEAADELERGQPHGLWAITGFDAAILPAEGHGTGIGGDQTGVRDGGPVGVTAQAGQNRLRPAEGRFGIDNPFGAAEPGEPFRKGIRLCQEIEIAERK